MTVYTSTTCLGGVTQDPDMTVPGGMTAVTGICDPVPISHSSIKDTPNKFEKDKSPTSYERLDSQVLEPSSQYIV